MKKFNNKYRGKSHRLPRWKYSSEAFYFLTIVTQNRVCNLGEIVNGKMVLSAFGRIVEIEWYKSFEIRAELILHEFVLMPNHLHTIVEIFNDRESVPANIVMDDSNDDLMDDLMEDSPFVDPHGRSDQQMDDDIPSIKRNPPIRLPKSISSFIAGFKSAVNTKIDDYIDEHKLDIPKYNRDNHFFQPNYHDHVIRNHEEYLRIKYYIIHNPKKWDKDKLSN